jgi:hypothetical protein
VPSITPQTTTAPTGLTSQGRTVPIVFPRANDNDAVVMGFDPGGKEGNDTGGHVGVTLACKYYYENDQGGWELAYPGWRVYDTFEMNPDEFIRWFAMNATGIDAIFGEMFRLDKERAYTLIGSTMPTSQLIGWTRMHCMLYAPHIDVNWQSNMVLKGPTASILREKGIKPVSPPGKNAARHSTGDHQRSSELHLWHGLIRAGLVEGFDPNIG